MALSTFSKFYYGISFNAENQNMNFDEGIGELVAPLNIGSFTLSQTLVQIKTALDVIGTQEYTVSVDRNTRQVTISAALNFDLLIDTGSQVGTSPWLLLGFTQTADLTGSNSYTGASAAGDVYVTQFPPQNYVDAGKQQQRIDASINESASGVIEVISFGVRKRMEMILLYITDVVQDGKIIGNNSTGVADAERFMQFLTSRASVEFMPDKSNSNDFIVVQLEKTATDSKGVGYLLKPETGKQLPDYYTTGKLTFRVF